MFLISWCPSHCPDKTTENTVGINIKLRLAEDGELEEGAARGPTLEFVLEKEQAFLKEEEVEEEEELKAEQYFQPQSCTKATENDRTELCSADSSKTPNTNSGPDKNPWPLWILKLPTLISHHFLNDKGSHTALHGALTYPACMCTTGIVEWSIVMATLRTCFHFET